MDHPTELTLLLHVATTVAMAGLIWFVQIVHYPLFAEVPTDAFHRYESLHCRFTGWVVSPLMLTELATGIILLIHPPSVDVTHLLRSGGALLAILWISTFAIQVPVHNGLSSGFNPRLHRLLVRTNWIRTAAWTTRAVIVLTILHRALHHHS